jgi:Uma2 family endonuclease
MATGSRKAGRVCYDVVRSRPMNAPSHALKTAELRRFTAAEFLRLYESGFFGKKERLRLIGGEVYSMAPTGPEHATGLGRLIGVLARALYPRFEIATDPTLRFSEHDVTEPDAVVIPPGPRPRPPIAIAEIQLIVETAHSSLEDDLTVMAAIYAAAGVPEYWVLDLENRRLVVFREPEAGAYAHRRNVEIGETESPLCAPDTVIAVADFF